MPFNFHVIILHRQNLKDKTPHQKGKLELSKTSFGNSPLILIFDSLFLNNT